LKIDIAGDSGSRVWGTGRSRPQWAQREALGLGAIAAGLTAAAALSAVVLRWFHLGKQSLWFDEGYTEFASSLSPTDIVRWARDSDFAPPLFLFLQHYWGALFGNSEYALRALSAFFGTLSLPVFYLLAKKVLKDNMAVALAMWLFAFSMMQVWYSQEARSYALLSFLALVGLYALVLFLERRSVALFASIVLSVAASLYTHNMMSFYLLALNVTWLIYPSERAWMQRVRELLLADTLAVVLYLPWVPTLLTQVGHFSQVSTWPPKPTVSHLWASLRVIAGFNLDYLQDLAVRFLPLSAHTAWVCVVGGVSLLCAALMAGGLWRVSRLDRSAHVSLLLYCLLPILVVFVYSRIATSVFIERVFINSSAVVPIVFAYPLTVQKGPKGRIFYGVLGIVLGATTALSGFGYLRYEQKEDWRGATSSLHRIPEKNRMILFISKTSEILFDYYARRSPAMAPSVEKAGFPVSFYERFPPPPRKIIDARDINRLKLAVESTKYSEIDLVLSHETGHDPNGLVFDYLNRVFVLQEEQRFNGIRIIRFLAPPH
jgi:mannosyltransferase